MAGPEADALVQTAVETTAPALLAYFVRRVEVAEDAADLLSDTLLVIWRKASSIPRDETEARMWMFGVARRVLVTHRRTHTRRSALQDKLRAELAGHTSAPSAEESLDVRAAIETLEPLDQEILRLVFWDGFTQAEVARLLEMPEGTVRSRTHRAREHLRQVLAAPTRA